MWLESHLRIWCQFQGREDLFLCFSGRTLGFLLCSVGCCHFELIFVGGVSRGAPSVFHTRKSSRSDVCSDCPFPVGWTCWHQWAAGVWVYACARGPISSLRVSVLHWFGCCVFAVSFEMEKCGFSNFAPFQDPLPVLGCLQFHVNLRIGFRFCRKGGCNFDRGCFGSLDHFGSYLDSVSCFDIRFSLISQFCYAPCQVWTWGCSFTSLNPSSYGENAGVIGPTSKGYCDGKRDNICRVYVTVLIGGVDNLLSKVKIHPVTTLADDPGPWVATFIAQWNNSVLESGVSGFKSWCCPFLAV